MTLAVYVAIYAGFTTFLIGCILRILQYARLPLHLRWELYPVPHEEPARVDHGGSYFESGEWWLSPQAFHHRRELTTMFKEIVFLKGLWEFNPRLWAPSFLFHFGLYLAIGTMALSAVVALPSAWFPNTEAARLAMLLIPACRWIGYAAASLVLIGAFLLFIRRITDPALKNYTKPADIFNLLFFITAVAFLTAGAFTRAPDTASVGQVARGLFRFDRTVIVAPAFGVGLVLTAALIAYIPFTHMSHFIAKYFTYHHVRWDDRRNERGSEIETKVAAYLQFKPTWSATHIGANGTKTWAEIATTNPTIPPPGENGKPEVWK